MLSKPSVSVLTPINAVDNKAILHGFFGISLALRKRANKHNYYPINDSLEIKYETLLWIIYSPRYYTIHLKVPQHFNFGFLQIIISFLWETHLSVQLIYNIIMRLCISCTYRHIPLRFKLDSNFGVGTSQFVS